MKININMIALFVVISFLFLPFANADDCLQETMVLLGQEKFKEADKYILAEDCEPEIKKKSGKTEELSAKKFSNDIMMIYSAHIGCEKSYEKYKKKAPSLRSPHALEKILTKNCGPESYSYKVIEDLERTTRKNLWKEGRWVKLIASEKDAEKKKKEALMAKKKQESKDRVKHEASAQHSLEEACHKHQRLQLIKSAIDDENNSAKFSGVKDKKRLLSLGRQANTFTKLLIKYKGEYKSRSGKSWDASLCK